MLAKTLWLTAGLLASTVSASDDTIKNRCGAPEPTMEDLANAAELARLERAARNSGGLAIRQSEPITVPTYFHVLAAGTELTDGYIPEQQLEDQIRVMNEDFAPHNIQFDLIETTRTINPVWARDGDQLNMKRQLRRGGYESLNLYFVQSAGGNLGYCYYPRNVTVGSDAFIRDGCTVLYSSVPGGSLTRYNLGRTATHEVGHWLDLMHPFANGCSCVGDMIHDTPAMSEPSFGCPIGKDSCPDFPGLDPLHNYMDYADDACMEEFTDGQEFRMRSAWRMFRTVVGGS